MVIQRNPSPGKPEDGVDPNAGNPVAEIIEELLQGVVPDEENQQDSGDNTPVTEGSDVEYDGSALYEELWSDVINSVHEYGQSIQQPNPDSAQSEIEGQEAQMTQNPELQSQNSQTEAVENQESQCDHESDVSVEYGPLSSISSIQFGPHDGVNREKPLIIYLLPNIHNFNVSRLPDTPPNTHFIQLTPSTYAGHFVPDHFAVELSTSNSQILRLPRDTHAIYLSSHTNVSRQSSGLSLTSQLNNLPGTSSMSDSLCASHSHCVLLRAGAHSSYSSIANAYRSTSSLSIQTTAVPVNKSAQTACGCRSLPTVLCQSADSSLSDFESYNRSDLSDPPDSSPSVSTGFTIMPNNFVIPDPSMAGDTAGNYFNIVPVTPPNSMHSLPNPPVETGNEVVRFQQSAPTLRSSYPRSMRSTTSATSSSSDIRKNENLGRKRRRRNANNRYLMEISADEENVGPELPGSSRFYDLLNNQESLQIWNNFMQCPEELQNRILQNTSKKTLQKKKSSRSIANKENRDTDSAAELDYSSHRAFRNLTDVQRNLLMQSSFPSGILNYLENLLIGHFEATPVETFTSPPLSSFERLILHALAAYYSLTSESMNDENGRRVTVVSNTSEVFHRPGMTLSQYMDYLEEKRRKKKDKSSTSK